VMVIVLKKRKRKKNSEVAISGLVGHTLESLTILPTEGLLVIIRHG
jgi:hypothetical protein